MRTTGPIRPTDPSGRPDDDAGAPKTSPAHLDALVVVRLRSLPRYRLLLTVEAGDAGGAAGDSVAALLACMPALTADDAARVLSAARHDGRAEVLTCPRELAEYYCDALRARGVPSAIEPA